jgi:hypothetical protein
MPSLSQTVSADRLYFRAASLRSIYSLPAKALSNVAWYAIIDYNTDPSCLSAVCRSWRDTINNDPRLWTTLVLRSWSGRDMVSTWLCKSKNNPLRVIIDADRRVHRSSETPFEGLQFAFKEIPRWKELIIISFPTDEALDSCNVTLCSPVKRRSTRGP